MRANSHLSDKAAEADKADTQHQQGHDRQAVLAQRRDALVEGRRRDRAGRSF